MKKYSAIALLLLVVMVFTMTSCAILPWVNDGTNDNANNPSSSLNNELGLLRSDIQVSQEQRLSQIKADNIKQNKGYNKDEEITVVISLTGESLLTTYNADGYLNYASVSQYAEGDAGVRQFNKISRQQSSVIDVLQSRKLIEEVKYTYSAVINAIAVTVKYGNLGKIEKMSGVESVIISDTFNMPTNAQGNPPSAIENIVDVYETGIFNSSSVDYTGQNTAVAILDSGFDLGHSVFANNPDNQLISQAEISSILGSTNAAKLGGGLDLFNVWYSGKIPFAYDYADKDANVSPYDSSHGTHVAGIIGGKDNVITGVATDTQLVLMKVFPDLDDGAGTDVILSALEDAVLLGVDAINMSLGSSCGFAREVDGDKINEVYELINTSGISLITAASNSYSSGFGGEQGNTNMVTNPDSGTVGSPSTYGASLSVASISGVKSRYMMGNDNQVIFFNESNSVAGKPNDFIKELGINPDATKQQALEYVTIPGSGLRVNYNLLGNMSGKIALVRRGDITFEEKALNAKLAGAAGCIIYNNIDGDILMSMGKADHIPTISISKSDGVKLAAKDRGTLTMSYGFSAGPFMSDFSSWGPTPSLGFKPEITAHGGSITSAVPGGGYDQISGTSMASPNLCGIMVLIRQFLKEKYPEHSSKEIAVLANQMLMSTATIIRNEEGNPYSPRKQGAGLASLKNVVNTKAYLTVDGQDRTKLELFDDPKKTGVYEMTFNVVNISADNLAYNLSVIGMTESVSSSDDKHVGEMSRLLSGNYTVSVDGGASISGSTVVVNANQTAKITLKYTLSQQDKALIDKLFPYGMYVEGFAKLEAIAEDEVDLNIPFLAFYGDWTQAPMFDKTYYEVESEAHDLSIDDEDKLKADYYATTPYGSYYHNYIIPLGTYLYDIDTSKYDMIPASVEHIALSNVLGSIDGIASVYAGLLRNAKTMTYTITDKVTGKVIFSLVDNNARKSYSLGGAPIPYYYFLDLESSSLDLINNRQYEFKMEGALDYEDGGQETNMRNSFAFDFYMDDEAPVVKEATYDKVYDKTLKKDRFYINLTVYDNHYVQSISPLIFNSSSSYTTLTENPIPVYSSRGESTVVRFEITDYLKDLYQDALISSALAFSIDDYALNSNIFLCQLPGTKGDFKFTDDGDLASDSLVFLNVYEDEVVDLTQYLATKDSSVDANKDYLKYLEWISSNENIASVHYGQVVGLSAGIATVTVRERMDLKQAILIINVKPRPKSARSNARAETASLDYNDANIESLRLASFTTKYAYARAGQPTQIGSTGDRKFLNAMSSVAFYPGESIQLFYDVEPWYVADRYKFNFSSTNPNVAEVNDKGLVLGLKEGETTIAVTVEGSRLIAKIKIIINNPFIIKDRTLVAYKGLGGDIVIPDDEGITTIGNYAFCLFETDMGVQLPENDFDANKIPDMNRTITSVVIPDGVEDIGKYAFYNSAQLIKVTIPDSVKYIREFAFYNNEKLADFDIKKVETIGRSAFQGCGMLQNVDLSKVITIGKSAFEQSGLTTADLTSLRNTGDLAFKNCSQLTDVILSENTKLSYAMFVNSGLTEVDIYNSNIQIPEFAFALCNELTRVTIHNDIVSIGKGAFSECGKLTEFNINGNLSLIGEQAFYASPSITRFVLPNNTVTLGNFAFYKCSGLEEIVFRENTELTAVAGSVFQDTILTRFDVHANNACYSDAEHLLLDKTGTIVILGAIAYDYQDYVLNSQYNRIGEGAFSGTNITTLTIANPNLVIGKYAFANCLNMTSLILPNATGVVIGNYAFNGNVALTDIVNLDKVETIGDYSFANTAAKNVSIAADSVVGEGAFFKSKVETVTIGANANIGLGAFQNCNLLKIVNMPQDGNVHFGKGCFANAINLETIDLSKVDSYIEDETFFACYKLKIAELTHVNTIGKYAFADCKSLNYVAVPVIERIGEGAFSKYSTTASAPIFMQLDLPDTLVELGDGAFLGCEGLGEIIIPASLQEIGKYVFAYCINMTTVELPSTITAIGDYAFAGCERLANINLNHIENIGELAFASTLSLTTVDFSNLISLDSGVFAKSAITGNLVAHKLQHIGDYAFQNARLTGFVGQQLATIGIAAFQYNILLTQVTLSDKLSYIGSLAFGGCSRLSSLYYMDENQVKTNNGDINGYAKLDNGVLYTKMSSGYYELKSVPSRAPIINLVIMDGVQYIDMYAGNNNEYVQSIVLPDNLKSIGAYAFYGYKNLSSVEFKSVIAPSLENRYDSKLKLDVDDPGYALLKSVFDMFEFELCYCNFKNLVGKETPIKMILPKNEDVRGYDSLIYEAYFGKVSNAVRSQYIAVEKSIIDFYEYSSRVLKLSFVNLTDEALVNNALSAYNSITQDYADYGYDKQDWTTRVDAVKQAKQTINSIKFANASQAVKQAQEDINNLPGSFELSNLAQLNALHSRIARLTAAERSLLDMTKYNHIMTEYNEYRQSVADQVKPIQDAYDSSRVVASIYVLLSGLAVALISKKIIMGVTR